MPGAFNVGYNSHHMEGTLPGGFQVVPPAAEPPAPDPDDAQLRAAMVRYSFMVQAYVWGEPDAPTSLPAPLAVPMSLATSFDDVVRKVLPAFTVKLTVAAWEITGSAAVRNNRDRV